MSLQIKLLLLFLHFIFHVSTTITTKHTSIGMKDSTRNITLSASIFTFKVKPLLSMHFYNKNAYLILGLEFRLSFKSGEYPSISFTASKTIQLDDLVYNERFSTQPNIQLPEAHIFKLSDKVFMAVNTPLMVFSAEEIKFDLVLSLFIQVSGPVTPRASATMNDVVLDRTVFSKTGYAFYKETLAENRLPTSKVVNEEEESPDGNKLKPLPTVKLSSSGEIEQNNKGLSGGIEENKITIVILLLSAAGGYWIYTQKSKMTDNAVSMAKTNYY